MLFDTYTSQSVEASLDALWLKTQVISNNMANVDTPGFKASNVSFEETLRTAAGRIQNHDGQEVSASQRAGAKGHYSARVTTDENTSVRLDGNNVVLEREQAELWKSYAQYSYLLDRIKGHYGNIGTAISNMRG